MRTSVQEKLIQWTLETLNNSMHIKQNTYIQTTRDTNPNRDLLEEIIISDTIERGYIIKLKKSMCNKCSGSNDVYSHVAATFLEQGKKKTESYTFHLNKQDVILIDTVNPTEDVLNDYSWNIYAHSISKNNNNNNELLQTPLSLPVRPLNQRRLILLFSLKDQNTDLIRKKLIDNGFDIKNIVVIQSMLTDRDYTNLNITDIEYSFLFKTKPNEKYMPFYFDYIDEIIEKTNIYRLCVETTSNDHFFLQKNNYTNIENNEHNMHHYNNNISNNYEIISKNTINVFEYIITQFKPYYIDNFIDVRKIMYIRNSFDCLIYNLNCLNEEWDVTFLISPSFNISNLKEKSKIYILADKIQDAEYTEILLFDPLRNFQINRISCGESDNYFLCDATNLIFSLSDHNILYNFRIRYTGSFNYVRDTNNFYVFFC
ncbi:MAG: hypothetical protein EOP34_02020 [Rickettsiales bacterium]|nr:MAG: hypothetical protein EOP34_02020 [Rickettsiales bacterium]